MQIRQGRRPKIPVGQVWVSSGPYVADESPEPLTAQDFNATQARELRHRQEIGSTLAYEGGEDHW